MILQRLIASLLIAGVIISIYIFLKRNSLQRKARQALELAQYELGKPAILYFTAPGCIPCKTIQRPALEHLHSLWGDQLQIIEFNALAEPKMADRWGVLSVPTTFIIDTHGRPRAVNHGTAKVEKLTKQLEETSSNFRVKGMSPRKSQG